jgi:hypothetical protein
VTAALADDPGVIVYGPEAIPRADPITFNEVFRLVQVQRYAGTITCMNSFHFGRETTGGSANSLVVDWRDNVVPTWKANVASIVTFTEAWAQRIMPAQDAVAAVTLTGGGTGSGTNFLPCVAAGLLTWRSQLVGRRRRGRSYVPGLTYDSATSNTGITWTAAGITRLTNIGTAILNRYTLGANPYGFQLIVWSRTTAFEPNQVDWRQGASLCTRFTVQSYIGSMGTRRGSRGI